MVSANHHISLKFGYGEGSTAHWTFSKPKNVIFFVHGFTGTAEETWHDIASYLREDQQFCATDLIFIGYDSTNCKAMASALKISKYIRTYLERPASNSCKRIYESRERLDEFSYEKIAILGHSLGGALLRQIVNDLYTRKFQQLNKIEIGLFAPAHKGAVSLDLLNKVMETDSTPWIFSILRGVIKYNKPVLQDLEPSSSFITNLEEVTLRNIAEGADGPFKCENTFFGDREKIVEIAAFGEDEPIEILDDCDHIEVCKSNKEKTAVLELCKSLFS